MADDSKRTIPEEIEVAGSQLVDKVKHLIREGNVRQLRIKAQDGDTQLEMPLTIGVLAGGAVALAAPWLAVLGVVAALVKHVKIEVEREEAEAPALPEGETTEG
ncbi:MAG TPA: DUF4342 domain-containing protein [Rubellimicrobium sp.]|jgi:hypothetical protein|nr:DUF4342 domain-containing protein [Rubellimicrobium sp.]